MHDRQRQCRSSHPEHILTASLLTTLLAPLPAVASGTEPMPTIKVTSPRISQPWLHTPSSVGTVNIGEMLGDPQFALDEALVRIPGLHAQNRYNLNQGLRLSIRGFGARASFGVRGVRVLLDGVPLTMPDGQTDLDALDLGLLEQVEVLRGPTSALYGNGAGGVLSLSTRAQPEQRHGRVDVFGGELGERRWRLEAGTAGETVTSLASVARRTLDGHRDNMAADSTIGTGRLRAHFAGGELEVSLHTLDIDARDPGALNLNELRSDRGAAHPNAMRYVVGEQIEQQRLSASWSRPLGARSALHLRGWGGERDFGNRLPFEAGGQTRFQRRFGGVGAQLDQRFRTGSVAHTLSIGGDLEQQRDDRQRHDNLDGARGDLALDQREQARGIGLFVIDQLALGGPWMAALGLRHDHIRLDVADAFLSDGDDSGKRDFRETSFNLGLGYRIGAHELLYARYGSGFETPTNNELANPEGGGFNPAVDPAQAHNLELGVKLERDHLRAELAIYRVRNEDELSRFEREDQPGRSFYRNTGATQRDGAELSVAWRAHPELTLYGSYSLNDYRFRGEGPSDQDVDGNRLPGIPRQQLFVEAAWRPVPAWTARLQATALDRVEVDDDNTAEVPGYLVLNARLAWTGTWGGVEVQPYLALNNAFDIDYIDNLRVNGGFGRYYEPAAGRVMAGGLSIRY